MDTKSSGVRLSPAKVSVSDPVASNVSRCEDVPSGSPVTRTRSESSPLSQPSNSIEQLETTLNIPKSATKAFRGSARKPRPSVPRSKSVVKSALKSVAKSKKLQIARKVEQAEEQGKDLVFILSVFSLFICDISRREIFHFTQRLVFELYWMIQSQCHCTLHGVNAQMADAPLRSDLWCFEYSHPQYPPVAMETLGLSSYIMLIDWSSVFVIWPVFRWRFAQN